MQPPSGAGPISPFYDQGETVLKILRLLIPTLIITGWLIAHKSEVRQSFAVVRQMQKKPLSKNQLRLGPEASGPISVPIRAPEELDFLLKEDVLRLRKEAVFRQRSLVFEGYSPSDEIFGAIEDKMPWWGLDGLYYYGPGKRGIDGASEESRFILNPYLLIALTESSAHIVKSSRVEEAFPKPLELQFHAKERRMRARYDVSRYFRYLERIGKNTPEERVLTIVAYNARDFGFHFLWVDVRASSGAYWFGKNDRAEPLLQMLHRGGSCGYPTGCNNMSPFHPEMQVSLSLLPATISIKLWKELPANPEGEPDFRVLLEVVDGTATFDLSHQMIVPRSE